jgi:hypothetical protein
VDDADGRVGDGLCEGAEAEGEMGESFGEDADENEGDRFCGWPLPYVGAGPNPLFFFFFMRRGPSGRIF